MPQILSWLRAVTLSTAMLLKAPRYRLSARYLHLPTVGMIDWQSSRPIYSELELKSKADRRDGLCLRSFSAEIEIERRLRF